MRRKPDRLAIAFAAIALSLSACDRTRTAGGEGNNLSVSASGNGAGAIEALAAESGVISETISDGLSGAYGRAYEGGEDRLCLDTPPGRPRAMAGVEIHIGTEEYCYGTGTAHRAGNDIILTLAEGKCIIAARDEGDRLVIPGSVDRACASLCSPRGSLAGVTFPLTARGRDAARRILTGDGDPLCR